MSGRYNDLQAMVAAENVLATWIPCAGHSLNLAGKTAAECRPAAVGFFDFFEAIFVFFTAFPRRYEMLTDSLKSAGSNVCVPRGSPARAARAELTPVKRSCRVIVKSETCWPKLLTTRMKCLKYVARETAYISACVRWRRYILSLLARDSRQGSTVRINSYMIPN